MKATELKGIRKRLGWTQKRLAEAVGIAPNALAMQERGEIGIREPVSRLIRLIAAGVDVETTLNPKRGRRGAAFMSPGRTRTGYSPRARRKGQGKDPVPGRRR